jgi:hypothetical protein
MGFFRRSLTFSLNRYFGKIVNNPAVLPVYWIVLGLVILIGDYALGPNIQFPFLYLLPVSLASWYSGFPWGLGLAVTMPLIRVLFHTMFWNFPLTVFNVSINTVIRILVLGGAAFLISRLAVQTQELAKRVKILEGILPLCSFCKKIRDQQGHWHVMEQFITAHSEAQFTHGFCPECGEHYYGEFFKNPG